MHWQGMSMFGRSKEEKERERERGRERRREVREGMSRKGNSVLSEKMKGAAGLSAGP